MGGRLERLRAADTYWVSTVRLTAAEAAALLSKIGQTLRNWKKTSAFPMNKLGGPWIVIRP